MIGKTTVGATSISTRGVLVGNVYPFPEGYLKQIFASVQDFLVGFRFKAYMVRASDGVVIAESQEQVGIGGNQLVTFPCHNEYFYGADYVLMVISDVGGNVFADVNYANIGRSFTVPYEAVPLTIPLLNVMSLEVTIYAEFSETEPPPLFYDVNINVPINGTTNPTGLLSVANGATLLISAIPDAGFMFDYWIIDNQETEHGGAFNPLEFIVNAPHVITAIFTAETEPPPPQETPCALRASTSGTIFTPLLLPQLRRFRDKKLPRQLTNDYYFLSRYIEPFINKLRGKKNEH